MDGWFKFSNRMLVTAKHTRWKSIDNTRSDVNCSRNIQAHQRQFNRTR